MANDGERIPVVFWPRFTTLTASATKTEYVTTPMDMLGFNWLSVTLLRSKIIGGGAPTIAFQFEESTDLDRFADLGGAIDPSTGTNVDGEVNFAGDIFRRYVRLRVTIENSVDSSVTLFAIGWAARTTS